MTVKRTETSMQAAMEAAIKSSPELKHAAEKIVTKVLKSIDHTLKWGTPQDKSAIQRQVLGVVMKSLASGQTDEASAAQQKAYLDLRGAIAGALVPEPVAVESTEPPSVEIPTATINHERHDHSIAS